MIPAAARLRPLLLASAVLLATACDAPMPTEPSLPVAEARQGPPGQGWSLVDLGPVSGIPGVASQVSASGFVAGSLTPEDRTVGFLLRRDRLEIVDPPGAELTVVDGVNERGTAVGFYRDGAGTFTAFRWRDGSLQPLPDLGGGYGTAGAISEAGAIVGQSETPAGNGRAVLWLGSRVVDLGTLGGPWSFAGDVLGAGRVVVGTAALPDGSFHAFRWTRREGMEDLGTLGGPNSHARAINRRGWIVGQAATGEGEMHATLWVRGRVIDLGTLGGGYSEAFGVDDRGRIVGTSETADGRQVPFVWERGRMVELPGAGAFGAALDITARGWIVGGGSRDGVLVPLAWRR